MPTPLAMGTWGVQITVDPGRVRACCKRLGLRHNRLFWAAPDVDMTAGSRAVSVGPAGRVAEDAAAGPRSDTG